MQHAPASHLGNGTICPTRPTPDAAVSNTDVAAKCTRQDASAAADAAFTSPSYGLGGPFNTDRE
eukprot:5391115-Pleurochrysis_carterae.AAC.1